MKADDCIIGIFAREPIAGRTKTRLIPLLGEEGAAQFHRQCIRAALRTARRAALGEVLLCVTPEPQADSFFYTLSPTPVCLLQTGDDLGARMHNAFVQGLQHAPRMIIIGTDCPALSEVHLQMVNTWLSQNEGACFIPAEDGGYVLVGMSRSISLFKSSAALFTDIDWGTDSVMQQTRNAAINADINLHELPPLWDIDTPEDYIRLSEDARFKGFFKEQLE
jgi:uncharacterized protein